MLLFRFPITDSNSRNSSRIPSLFQTVNIARRSFFLYHFCKLIHQLFIWYGYLSVFVVQKPYTAIAEKISSFVFSSSYAVKPKNSEKLSSKALYNHETYSAPNRLNTSLSFHILTREHSLPLSSPADNSLFGPRLCADNSQDL